MMYMMQNFNILFTTHMCPNDAYRLEEVRRSDHIQIESLLAVQEAL